MDFKIRIRLAFLSLGLVLYASVMGEDTTTLTGGPFTNATQVPESSSITVPTTAISLTTNTTETVATDPRTTPTTEPVTFKTEGVANTTATATKQTGNTYTITTTNSYPQSGVTEDTSTADAQATKTTAFTMTIGISAPGTTNLKLTTSLKSLSTETISTSGKSTTPLSTPEGNIFLETSSSEPTSAPVSRTNPAPPGSGPDRGLEPTNPAKDTAIPSAHQNNQTEHRGLGPTTLAKTTAILPKDQNIQKFFMRKGGKEMPNSTDLVNICTFLMSHFKDGANCSLTRYLSNKTIDTIVSGSVETKVINQFFDQYTIINDKTTLIAIITPCAVVLVMIICCVIYASFHRKPYRKNHQLYLTEELQTVENGYHDNPTLEVEVQPEMQEKKVALNGEFNDCWIAPFDSLPKESVPLEEDTHL